MRASKPAVRCCGHVGNNNPSTTSTPPSAKKIQDEVELVVDTSNVWGVQALEKVAIARERGRGAPESVDLHVARRLRERRVMLGMSQHELAARIGVTCQQAQKYEAGANRLSAARLFDIANALEVDVAFLFEELGNDKKPKTDARQRLLLDLVRNFASLPNRRSQELVCALVRSLAGADCAPIAGRPAVVQGSGEIEAACAGDGRERA